MGNSIVTGVSMILKFLVIIAWYAIYNLKRGCDSQGCES